MKRFPFFLLLLCVAVLAIATFIEDSHGTSFIHTMVYGAWWFQLLWAVVAASAIWTFCTQKLWRRWLVLGFHLSLILVLVGGFLTAQTRQKGILHLRQGEEIQAFVDNEKHVRHFSFSVCLDTFFIQPYPHTATPQDFVSRITVTDKKSNEARNSTGEERLQAVISMNRIFHHDGYRFYQTSYDPDGHGSWLTVTYDPWGTPVAYAGFLLFGLFGVMMLLSSQGTFRKEIRHLNGDVVSRPNTFLCLAMLLAFGAAVWPWQRVGEDVSTEKIPCVSRALADSLAMQPVVWNGRICPLNTLATDVVTKISGKRNPHGYSPEQVVVSWARYPDVWNRAPLIKVKDAGLRQRLGIEEQHIALSQLYDGERYRLQQLWDNETDKQSKLCKAIRETDERVALVGMIIDGSLIERAPVDAPPLSAFRLQAELLYNRLPFVSILFMANLTLGLLALLFLLFQPSVVQPSSSTPRHFILSVLHSALYASTILLIFAYVLRWYVSGHIPLSNGFETMMFVALAILLVACWLSRRFQFAIPFGFLLSGFTLLVAHLGLMNPQVSSLMPVLNSPWLSSHVSSIMIAYALLSFTFLIALFYFALSTLRSSPSSLQQFTQLSRLLLYPAVMLLGLGIFLGAVWANVSWGAYWSWDPKEVWALITFLVYSLPLHRSSLPLFQRSRAYHFYMLLAFLTVLMTYFGVNFLLGGMHSYANAS